jgi:hypothetical protein
MEYSYIVAEVKKHIKAVKTEKFSKSEIGKIK